MDGGVGQFEVDSPLVTKSIDDLQELSVDESEQWQGVMARFNQAIKASEISKALTILNHMVQHRCPDAFLDDAHSRYFNALVAAHCTDAREALEKGGFEYLGSAKAEKALAMAYIEQANSMGILIDPSIQNALDNMRFIG